MKNVGDRQCIVCKQVFNKRDLLKFVNKEGEIHYDCSKKSPGRGIYICKNCIEKKGQFLDKKYFARAIKSNISEQDYERIKLEYESTK